MPLKNPLFQFPVDHQANIINSVSPREDTLQEIKVSSSMVSNSTAWMYTHGYMYVDRWHFQHSDDDSSY
jgi:hypothetical protein